MKDWTRREFLGTATKTAAAGAALGIIPRNASARILGANDRIRFGIIGPGSRGQEDLKNAIKCTNVELVGMADVYPRRFDEVHAFAPSVTPHNNFKQLLDRKDVDAVIVATPLHLHAPHFLAAVAAGKDLYSEKTMTWSVAEAQQCVDSVRKSKQIVQIGMQHESEGSHADAKKWVADGKLGKVNLVEAWMGRNTPHGQGQWTRKIPADCTAANVGWDQFLMNRPKAAFDGNRFINWRFFWEYSGGNITENFSHQIAWLSTVLNLNVPIAAYMTGGIFSEKDGREVPDTISLMLEYPELTINWQSTFSNKQYGLGERIMGSDGSIEHVSGSNDMVSGASASGHTFYPEKMNSKPGTMSEVGKDPGVNHMQNWFDCIRSRKEPNAPVETGFKSAVACHMANLAYQNKRRVTFEEAKTMTYKY
jgi:predicted dehydrogenase